MLYTGELLHGLIFPPLCVEEGRKYPTVLYLYGGPQIQARLLILTSLCWKGKPHALIELTVLFLSDVTLGGGVVYVERYVQL